MWECRVAHQRPMTGFWPGSSFYSVSGVPAKFEATMPDFPTSSFRQDSPAPLQISSCSRSVPFPPPSGGSGAWKEAGWFFLTNTAQAGFMLMPSHAIATGFACFMLVISIPPFPLNNQRRALNQYSRPSISVYIRNNPYPQ